MKKACAIFLMAMAAIMAVADQPKAEKDLVIRNPDGTIKRFPKAEFEKLPEEVQKAMRREFFRTHLGDRVVKPGSGKGIFKFVSCSKVVRSADFKKAEEPIRQRAKIAVGSTDYESFVPTKAVSALKDVGANAAVFVVDDESLPRLMVAPEEGWAVVNVTALATDNPQREVLVKRTVIELIRAFAFVCGSATDDRGGMIMKSITSVADLDKIPSASYRVVNFDNMARQLSSLGIEPVVAKYYLNACQEGWAPQPTNDAQRAIWNEVHKLPSAPLKLEK